MMNRSSLLLIAVLSVLLSGLTSGEATDRDAYLIFQLDNDLFTGSDTDYTNGARFAYMQPISADSMNRFQNALKGMSGVEGPRGFGMLGSLIETESTLYDYGIGLTQVMFTPDDPELLASPPGQRPYAAWLGLELSLHAKNETALSSVVLSIGVTGKYAFGEETQEWVHTNISNSPIFQGWDSQIPTEVTLNLNFDRKRRYGKLADATKDWILQVDGYFEWGAYLGNALTEAYVGTMVRVGYKLPLQYMTPRLQFGNYPHELFSDGEKGGSAWSLYAFAGGRGSAVLHNITLDGPVFRSFDTGTASESFVGELIAGVGVRFHGFTFAYSRTFRSKEFEGQLKSHQFGSVLISAAF